MKSETQPVQVEDASSRRALGIIMGIVLAAALVLAVVFITTAQSDNDCASEQTAFLLDDPNATSVPGCD